MIAEPPAHHGKADVEVRHGKASWYSDKLAGHIMANGHPYNPTELTCASWDYPMGAILLVESGGAFVRVKVTDRGPNQDLYVKGRLLDLSKAAFRELGYLEQGVIEVTIIRL
jgi:rare lipoprotein A